MENLFDFGSADIAASAIAALPLALAVIMVTLAVFMLRSFAVRSIADNATRYRVRKALAYGGMFIVVLLLLSAFSTKVAQLSVIIGAIGAGVAFALQEVIASLAGWGRTVVWRILQAWRPGGTGRHQGRCDRHRDAAHDPNGNRRMGERRSI